MSARKELRSITTRLKQHIQEQQFLDPEEILPASAGGAAGTTAANRFEDLRETVRACKKCRLGLTRIQAVFGEGNTKAKIMFIGEGPGFEEDHQGKPFIGRAGQLLTKIIESMKYRREDVFIANIVKCHPMVNPENPELKGNDRPPAKDETAACIPYLYEQIELINPSIICTLGNPSTQALLETQEPISKMRGKVYAFRGRKLIPTFHPAALLRNPNLKADTWKDMKLLLANLPGAASLKDL